MDVLVRSRTGLFLSYRDSRARLSRPRQYPESPYAAADDEHEGLIPASPSHTALDLDLPPKWSYSCRSCHPSSRNSSPYQGRHLGASTGHSRRRRGEKSVVASSFSRFTHSFPVTTLEKLHAKHVLPGFTDRSSEEREIEGITTDITKVFCQPSSGHLSWFLQLIVPAGLPPVSGFDPTHRNTTAYLSTFTPRCSIDSACGVGRKKCSTRIGRKGPGSQRHFSKETTGLHGE
jgi:syntaxin 16